MSVFRQGMFATWLLTRRCALVGAGVAWASLTASPRHVWFASGDDVLPNR